jgi:VCBS repeat-containing protein
MLIGVGFHHGPLAFSMKSSPAELIAAYYRRGYHEVVRVNQTAEWSYQADNNTAAVEGRGIEALARLIADEDWDGGHARMTLLLAGA